MSPRRARERVGGTGYPLSGKAQTGENGSHGPHHRSRTGAGLAGMSERTRRPVVTLVAHGRAGQVHYREGDHAHAFGWELGGREVVFIVYVPSAATWDAELPWAAGRRADVLDTVASELRRQHCRGCEIEFGDTWVYLREPPRTPRGVIATLARGLLWYGSAGAAALAFVALAAGSHEYPGFTAPAGRFLARHVLPLALVAALWLTVLWRPRSGLALRLAALAAALGLLLLELPHLYLGAPAVTVGSVVVAACLLAGGTTRLLLGER